MQDVDSGAIPRKRGRPMGSENMTTLELARRIERLREAGVMQGVSAKVLYALMADQYWLKIVGELEAQEDWKTITEVLKFHQQMHEGRPAQRITVTSIGVTFSAEEIARARGALRELVPIAVSETPLRPDASKPTDGQLLLPDKANE